MSSQNPYRCPAESVVDTRHAGAATFVQRLSLATFVIWPLVYWFVLADLFQFCPSLVKAALIGLSAALVAIQFAVQRGRFPLWAVVTLGMYLFIVLQIATRPNTAEEYL
jgi:hypothetical protein